MNKIELCFSPELISKYSFVDKVVVVVDILRATSIITTMFMNGLNKLIPVKTLEEAKEYEQRGFLVAAERNGKKVDFAHFDNHPSSFSSAKIKDKTIVYSTTNGTNTINMVANAKEVVIASYLNFSAVLKHLLAKNNDVLIICSGWKGTYCIEDSLFAGALSEKLCLSDKFGTESDAVISSIDLWNSAKSNLKQYIKKTYQYKRLEKLGLKDVINYCFTINKTSVVPVFENYYIKDYKK